MGDVRMWETAAGDLVGAAHPEDPGNAFPRMHPDFRHLEDEIVAWAEERLAAPTPEGRRVDVNVHDHDTQRQELLARRGFVRGRSTDTARPAEQRMEQTRGFVGSLAGDDPPKAQA